MEEIKNENINEEAAQDATFESEEVMEVALAETEEKNDTEDYALADYTEAEMSGLTDEQRRRKELFDKFTTGVLIFLLASPALIILYILIWFLTK